MNFPRATLALVLCTTLGVAVACGSNGGTNGQPPTATISSGSTPTSGSTAASPTSSRGEGYADPGVYFRTADNFQSIQAGKPYKVLFRITNGYAEPALTVVATCETCSPAGEPVALQGQRAEPVGSDAPGSYYPMNITLPAAGRWQLVVQAGNDTARLLVDVRPG